MVRKRPDIRCFWQKDDRPGVLKDKYTADDFSLSLNVKMQKDNRSCRFSSEFFTTSQRHTAESMKGHLRQELEVYHYEYKDPKELNSAYKITGKNAGKQDDATIAYCMNIIWPPRILKCLSRVY